MAGFAHQRALNAHPMDQPTVLIVEDDPHIAQVLLFLIQRRGCQAIHLSDGAKAAAACENLAAPQLVLVDAMLPWVDGFDLLSRMRAAWPSTPLIMVSAKSSPRDIERAMDAGADDYIVKPFEPKELLRRVELHLAPKNP